MKAIFAVDSKNGLGKNGTLPWPHNKDDMKYFKQQTIGSAVVMGRTTWDDPKMPKPLPDRINIVVTSKPLNNLYALSTKIDKVKDLPKLLGKEVWVIGGAKLLEATITQINEIHLTKFHGDFGCDTFVDLDFLLKDFIIVSGENIPAVLTREVYKRNGSIPINS